MIRQHFVRAFERGAGRDHRPNIELKRDVCEVTFDMEDSTILHVESKVMVCDSSFFPSCFLLKIR